ncbi:MAG TPA: glycoside hydrolase family 172 protein [Victivallales bacterium]|nr:glycoside hydrolase family 172 protein [Victivallales bacterium]
MAPSLNNIYLQRQAESRSISAENPLGALSSGAKETPNTKNHPSRELGKGWKVNPFVKIEAGKTKTIMNIEGPGVIRHIWVTLNSKFYRDVIIRFYWDGEISPSVEVPIGDFFCNSWNKRQIISGIPINVNPSGGMNMFFPMPFKKNAKITIENGSVNDLNEFFYTINYTLEKVSADSLYFHSYWNRQNPTKYKEEYIIVDNIKGRGSYVGTFISWQQNNEGWWGEGELKMFMDNDKEYPTICGTGTEDYFGGAWCFEDSFSAPYFGFREVSKKSGETGARMTMYRFHIHDPVLFKKKFKVNIQALGWRNNERYLPLQDDISSVAYWYQTVPHNPFKEIPDRNKREII